MVTFRGLRGNICPLRGAKIVFNFSAQKFQAANIGVGISGHEGRQAVMSSDYAMPRFRFLPRLLLVHGHLNYVRLSYMIKYFYYKNSIFILLIFWYQIFSSFSGSNMISDIYLILFMLLFNSVPPIVNATLDQFLPRHGI